MNHRHATLCIGLLVASLAIAREVRGCKCGPPRPIKVEVRESAAVFVGEAIARRDIDFTEDGFPLAAGYTFRVYRAWKGVEQQTVEVATMTVGLTCIAHFFEGDEYLVFADRTDVEADACSYGKGVRETPNRPVLWTGFCARGGSLGWAEGADLKELGQPSWVDEAVRVSILTEELWEASRRGDSAAVERLIIEGHDVNGKARYHDETALIAAARGGHTETARALLEAGAEVNELKRGRTALMMAVTRGDVETLRLLLEAGAEVNDDRLVMPPLDEAVRSGRSDVVALLAEAGAVVTPNALAVAAGRGDRAFVRRFLTDVSPMANTTYGSTVFRAACQGGDVEIIDMMLAAGADVNQRSIYGDKSALEGAARNGQMAAVRRLLAAGAEVGEAELEAASRKGGEVLQALLEARRASPEKGDITADVLITAVYSAAPGDLQLLLDENPDVNAEDRSGSTALHQACAFGRVDAIRALVEAGADVDKPDGDGRTALRLAMKRSPIEAIELLLDHGADPNGGVSRWATPLMVAAETGNLEAVELLLAAGAGVNESPAGGRHETALSAAARGGDPAMVRRLLEAGADARLGAPLWSAAHGGRLSIVKMLLEAGAPVDDEKYSPLVGAAASRHLEVVTTLLESGADPLRAPEALHTAAAMGSAEIVHVLIERGMDVNAVEAMQPHTTPLHHAVGTRSLETVHLLLEAGADINARMSHGRTPLMSAIHHAESDVWARENRRKQDPTWVDPRLAMIEVLLEAGADIEAVDADGRTALDMAEEIGDSEAVALLRRE